MKGERDVATWEMEENLRKLRGNVEEPLDSTAVLKSMKPVFRGIEPFCECGHAESRHSKAEGECSCSGFNASGGPCGCQHFSLAEPHRGFDDDE